LVKSLGAPAGLDIWRFRFPKSVIWREPRQEGLCLTNNRVVWEEERPRYYQNRDAGGSYSYSLAPDAMPDAAATGDISFAQGHLTDRRQSLRATKTGNWRAAPYALPASRWMVSWAKIEPVSVTFDLRQPWKATQFKLWFGDTLPQVTVEGSLDGEKWRAVGEVAGEDVYDLTIALNQKTACRYLRASFAARKTGQKLTLVEAEVWGE
jgi:hypothetical protein